MGIILGTLFRSGRLVRFENGYQDKRKTAIVTCLEQLKEKGKTKLGIATTDKVSVVETATGHEIEDEECFAQLKDIPRLTILNVSKGEIWTRPQDMPMPIQSHPPRSLSPNHQVTRDASGSFTINVVNIQAHAAQMGDHNQILCSGGSAEPTQGEDAEA